MGTSIACFLPNSSEWRPAELEQQLNALCLPLRQDIEQIQAIGRFSASGGLWYVVEQAPEPGEPRLLVGEGPAGLGIYVYGRIICLTSAERFGALYEHSWGVALPLRRVLCSLADSLGTGSSIAAAAAGFGDTDAAADGAYYGSTTLEQVCEILMARIGPPTKTWDGLRELGWYRGPPDPLA